MYDRQKIGMITAELLGTFMLASVALASGSFFTFTAPWYVALSVALTLTVLVLAVGRVSGAHVNPAITIGLWTLRKIQTPQALVYLVAQMLGGVLALLFYEYITNTNTAAFSNIFDVRVYIAETVGAAIFAFGVAAVVMQKLEGLVAAFAVGFSLFLGVIIAASAAPGFLNPAVAFASGAFNWTVVTAPILGAIIGMNLYSLLLAPRESLKKSATKKK